jgi:hypothetical protein
MAEQDRSIAYIAFPLMLSSLDEMMSPRDSETNREELLTRYHAQAMHLCSQRFEGAVDISRMITQIVQSTPVQLPLRISSKSASPSNTVEKESPTTRALAGYWDDLFVTRNYMKLRLSLDYALITGRPPNATDIPSSLLRDVGIKRLSFGPLHSLSSVTLHQPRKRRASETVNGTPRVVELDGKPATPEVDVGSSKTMEDFVPHDSQMIARQEGSHTLSRPFFDYDTIWAASLFEEITDEIWS